MRKLAVAAMALSCLLLCGCGRKYTVSFDLNGGKLVSGETEQIVKAGEAAEAPEAENGCLRLSWDRAFDNISSDTVVTAVWDKVPLNEEEMLSHFSANTVSLRVRYIDGSEASGWGVFIDRDGTVLSSYRLINGAESIELRDGQGKTLTVGAIEGFDIDSGLALLDSGERRETWMDPAGSCFRGERVYTAIDNRIYGGMLMKEEKVNLLPCLRVDMPIDDSMRGLPLVNQYGDLLGLCAFGFDEGKENFALNAAATEQLPKGDPMTLKNYAKWYREQCAMSYSPYDESIDGFCYSMTYRYDTVTGAPCLGSVDTGGRQHDGFVDCCYYYRYEQNEEGLNKYTEYLLSKGYEDAGSEEFGSGTSQYYRNDVEDIQVDMFLRTDGTELWIFVTRY